METIKGTYETQGNQERVNFGKFGYICRTVIQTGKRVVDYEETISFGGGLTEEKLMVALSAAFGRQIDVRFIWSEAYGSAVGFAYDKKFKKGCKVVFA